MAEYIDREAVKEMVQKHRCLGCTNEKSLDCPLCQLHRLFADIGKIPTADVVEIVRCRDCVHRDPEDKKCDGAFQARGGIFQMDDDDFCSYGERRKENGEIY